MKNKRFELESDIIKHIYEDNQNTVHFDYHVDIDGGSITLDLFTFNKRNNSVFLLHKAEGRNSIEALTKMCEYIKSESHEMFPYTVTWERSGDNTEYKSYFWERNELSVYNKFFYNKNPKDYKITISLRPLS